MSTPTEMTPEERSLLSDPFLSPTTEIGLLRRSEEFQREFRKRFSIPEPERSAFDIALDSRLTESPRSFMGELNALMRTPSVRDELAKRDPRFKAKWKENIIDEVALEFRRQCPDYLSTERNYDTIVSHLSEKYLGVKDLDSSVAVGMLFDKGVWGVEELSQGYLECLEAGVLEVPAGTTRNLSEREKLEIVSIAQMNSADAIVRYIELSLGGLPSGGNASAVARFRAHNPQVCNEGTLFVFRNLHGNSLTDSEFNELREMLLARSPLLTYQMVLDGYAEYRRSSGPSPTPTATGGRRTAQSENLDDLSDEEIAARLTQARRAAVRSRGAA